MTVEMRVAFQRAESKSTCSQGALMRSFRYAGSVIGAGAALPRIRSEPFSAITMVAE